MPAPRDLVRTAAAMAVGALFVASGARTAAADTFGAQAHYLTGTTHVHQLELAVAPAVSEPSALEGKNLRLFGYGGLRGLDLRFDVLIDAARLGLGVSYFGMHDVSLETDALEPGITVRPAAILGSTVELFVGQEIGQGPVYPYIDLRGTFSLLQVDIETLAEPYGHVGTTHYVGWRLGLGPRFGVLIPVGHSTMVDIAVTQRLVGGVEETTFGFGLGYWENDRSDDFSQYLRGHSWRGQI